MIMIDKINKKIGVLCFALLVSPAWAQDPYLLVLGVAQDAGVPQAGTTDSAAWADSTLRQYASSLGLIDPLTRERWVLDATPDFREQLHALDLAQPTEQRPGLAGILLTHAHIGHYLGLAQLGREVMGANSVPVYAMPQMRRFLNSNGPWNQLIELNNIEIRELEEDQSTRLNRRLSTTPIRVPHREEYSEVVGFTIQGPNRVALYIPDIDKWERWDDWGVRIEDMLGSVDVAFLDGTFFADGELGDRDMSRIPHPFIAESMQRFSELSEYDRSKIQFIHLNHSNPVLLLDSPQRAQILQAGFGVASTGDKHAL